MSRRKECIINVSVFSTSGGMGPTANMIYKEYPQWLPRSRNMTKHTARSSIASDERLRYSLLCSAIMCVRGARSSIHHPTTSPQWTATKAGSLYIFLVYTLHLLYLYLIDWIPRWKKKGRKKKKKESSTVVKKSISKIILSPCDTRKLPCRLRVHPFDWLAFVVKLVWWVSGTWEVARTKFAGTSPFAGIALIWLANFWGKCSNFGGNVN